MSKDEQNDSLARDLAIDKICQRFEEAWRPPAVEKFAELGSFDEQGRELLLKELALTELELRRRLAITDKKEFLARFPDLNGLDDSLLGTSQLENQSENHAGCGYESLADRYRSIEQLSKGGLGKVNVEFDQQVGRRVAVKRVRDRYARSPEHRSRLIKEARITGQLQHPGIVPVYDISVAGSDPFYSMKLIEGEELKLSIKNFYQKRASQTGEENRLAFRKLVGVFQEVCNTISYAHSQNVIHRDLKPDNVMIGRHGETIVVDWGLAKSLEANDVDGDSGEFGIEGHETRFGDVVGTPFYMSPEQADGKIDRVSYSSDIYSLGATLYSILTGLFPNESKASGASERSLPLYSPSDVNPQCPKPLEKICLKAMDAEQDNRYSSVEDLAHDVERWLAGEKVSVHNESLWIRSERFFRRNKAALTGLITAVAVALCGLTIFSFALAKKNEELSDSYFEVSQQKKAVELAQLEVEGTARKLRVALDEANEQRKVVEQEWETNVSLITVFLDELGRLALAQNPFETKLIDVLPNLFDRILGLKEPRSIGITGNLLGVILAEAESYVAAIEVFKNTIAAIESSGNQDQINELVPGMVSSAASCHLYLNQPDEADALLANYLNWDDESDDGMAIRCAQTGVFSSRLERKKVIKFCQINLDSIAKDPEHQSHWVGEVMKLASVLIDLDEFEKVLEILEPELRPLGDVDDESVERQLQIRESYASAYMFADKPDSLKVAREILEEATQFANDRIYENSESVLEMESSLSTIYTFQGENEKAIELLEKSKSKALKRKGGENQFIYGDILAQLSLAYLNNKEFDKGKQAALEAHNTFRVITGENSIYTISMLLRSHNAGYLSRQVDPPDLLEQYRDFFMRQKDHSLYETWLVFIADSYYFHGDFSNALESYVLLLEYLNQFEDGGEHLALYAKRNVLIRLADLEFELGNHKPARNYLELVRQEADKVLVSPSMALATCYKNIAEVKIKLEDFEEALEHLKFAYDEYSLDPKSYSSQRFEVAELICAIYEKLGDEENLAKWTRKKESNDPTDSPQFSPDIHLP